MRIHPRLCMGALIAFTSLSCSPKDMFDKGSSSNTLSYDHPATKWTEALPLGNGSFGAMIYGHPRLDTIKLNQDTFWNGGPSDWNNPEAKKYFPLIQAALKSYNHDLADSLVRHMQGKDTQPYQPLGDLVLKYNPGKITSYERSLNLSNGIYQQAFTADNVTYHSTAFASYPDDVIAIQIESSEKGKLNFEASLSSIVLNKTFAENDILKLRSKVWSDSSWNREGVEAEVWLKVIHEGGELFYSDKSVKIKNANKATLLLVSATSFNGRFKSPEYDGLDPAVLASKKMARLKDRAFEELAKRHIDDYQSLYNRAKLDLKAEETHETTDKRIANYSVNKDKGLVELLFNYGRYLLICSSRPGSQPANLQGIWSKQIYPPWRANYTININTEMNYWPAEVTNLSELTEPLLSFIPDLAKNGEVTARTNYGLDGWVAHHNSDLWAQSGPVAGDPMWSNWTMGGAWLTSSIFEHYYFTGDQGYLKNNMPIIDGAARFVIGMLIRNGGGYLEPSMGTSPENQFISHSGKPVSVTKGVAMDLILTRELLVRYKEALELLDPENTYIDTLRNTIAQIRPLIISEDGMILEWDKPYEEKDIHHRHVSHLYGLYPGNQINPWENPELFCAAKNSLIKRGDEATGWSMGWKINLWARLLDGDHAREIVDNLIRRADAKGEKWERPGLYANLFDAHPPFQIDGNFGYTAGIAEMLLQSHNGELHILPALPTSWEEGTIKGLKARGGYEIDLSWSKGEIEEMRIIASKSGPCIIRSQWELDLEPVGADDIVRSDIKPVGSVEPIFLNDKLDFDPALNHTYIYEVYLNKGESKIVHADNN